MIVTGRGKNLEDSVLDGEDQGSVRKRRRRLCQEGSATNCFKEVELLCGVPPLTAELWYATGKAMHAYTDETNAGWSGRCGSAIGR